MKPPFFFFSSQSPIGAGARKWSSHSDVLESILLVGRLHDKHRFNLNETARKVLASPQSPDCRLVCCFFNCKQLDSPIQTALSGRPQLTSAFTLACAVATNTETFASCVI